MGFRISKFGINIDMSMMAVIKKLNTGDLGEANASFDKGIQKIKDSILTGVVDVESEYVNDKIAVRGIVQNDMNLSFTNNWNTTLFHGISDVLEGTSFGVNAGVQANVKGSSILKLANTVASATGYNIAGTGPASKKIYQGSNLSGFAVTLKWYTPKSNKWRDQLKALTSLAWPVYMGRDKKTPPINTERNNPPEGFVERVKGVIDGLTDIAGGAIDNLIARNPEKVQLIIYHSGYEDDSHISYRMTPLVITAVSLQGSRETYRGAPVIVTATINFEYYQINASGSTATKQFFGGAPIFDAPRINYSPTTVDNIARHKQTEKNNIALNSSAPASSTSVAFKFPGASTPNNSAFGSDINVVNP